MSKIMVVVVSLFILTSFASIQLAKTANKLVENNLFKNSLNTTITNPTATIALTGSPTTYNTITYSISHSTAPKWAKPGAYLVYAVFMKENISKNELEESIRDMLLGNINRTGVVNITLIDMDEEKGTFLITGSGNIPSFSKKTNCTYWWGGGVFNCVSEPEHEDFIMLMPLEIPENASITNLHTLLGEFEAYKVEQYLGQVTTTPSANGTYVPVVSTMYRYYHIDSEIPLALIMVLEWDQRISVGSFILIDTNIPLYTKTSSTPSTTPITTSPTDTSTTTTPTTTVNTVNEVNWVSIGFVAIILIVISITIGYMVIRKPRSKTI